MKIAIYVGAILVCACAAVALSYNAIEEPRPAPPVFGPDSEEPAPFPSSDESGLRERDPRYARSAATLPTSHARLGSTEGGERSSAYATLMRADRSIYNNYDDHTLRALAERDDSEAQLALAVRLFETDPQQAMRFARRAAAAGSSVAVTMVADEMAGQGDAAGGLAAMIEFEEAHGADAFLTRYMRSYLQINAKSQTQLREQARLRVSMKRLGSGALPAPAGDVGG